MQKKLKILLVDDDQAFRTNYRLLLEQEGHEIVCAVHADEARVVFMRHRAQGALFDLFLIDIDLPGIHGTTLHAMMRSSLGDCLAVLITGAPHECDRAYAQQEGLLLLHKTELSTLGVHGILQRLHGHRAGEPTSPAPPAAS